MGVELLAWSNPSGLMAGLMGMFEQVTPGWLIGILIMVYYIYNPYYNWVGFHPQKTRNKQGLFFSLLR